MEFILTEIAQRIRALRDILGFSTEEMAQAAGCSAAEYKAAESGESDFSFTFLYKCAVKFGVDMVELVTGDNPHLSLCSIVRKGEGLPIKRRSDFNYYHLGYRLKNKLCEPFLVTAPYAEAEQAAPIPLSTHEGQEFNYVLQGSLKFEYEGRISVLQEGDSALYDSGNRHGMVAADGKDCLFLAIVLKPEERGNES